MKSETSNLFPKDRENPNMIIVTPGEISIAEFVGKYTKEFQSFRRIVGLSLPN